MAGLGGAQRAPARRRRTTRAWPSSTGRSTSGPARSGCTRRCRTSRAAPTLEGVYNQAATTTHPVYYLASELFARSPNPFRSRQYSRFDPGERPAAGCGSSTSREIVAVSPELEAALDARPDVVREASDSALRGLPPARPAARLRRAARVRARARLAAGLARRLVPLDDPQAGEPGAPRVHGRPALRARARHLVAAARAASRGRRRGALARRAPSGSRSRTSRPGAPAARQGLVPPALARRGRRRAVPGLAGADARRAAADRRHADLRRRARGPITSAGRCSWRRSRWSWLAGALAGSVAQRGSRRAAPVPVTEAGAHDGFGAPSGEGGPATRPAPRRWPRSRRCGSPRSAGRARTSRGSTSAPRALTRKIAGRTRPSTRATRSTPPRRRTRGGRAFVPARRSPAARGPREAGGARLCARGRRRLGSLPAAGALLGSARARAGGRRGRAPRPGARACAPTIRRRPGPRGSGAGP